MSVFTVLADAITSAIPDTNVSFAMGSIASVTSGVATVATCGDTIEASHLASYTPTASDVVAVLFVDGSPLILGQVTGQPTV